MSLSQLFWGDYFNVRDCNVVKPQLTNVQQLEASGGAFAAILDDGSVFTWGEAEYGGDCSAVQGQLQSERQIGDSNCYKLWIGGEPLVIDLGRALGHFIFALIGLKRILFTNIFQKL